MRANVLGPIGDQLLEARVVRREQCARGLFVVRPVAGDRCHEPVQRLSPFARALFSGVAFPGFFDQAPQASRDALRLLPPAIPSDAARARPRATPRRASADPDRVRSGGGSARVSTSARLPLKVEVELPPATILEDEKLRILARVQMGLGGAEHLRQQTKGDQAIPGEGGVAGWA